VHPVCYAVLSSAAASDVCDWESHLGLACWQLLAILALILLSLIVLNS